jgi:preprotein translocase subunit YajC
VEFLIVMVLLLGVMYVLMIRPQRKRQQDHQSMIDSCGVGEDVLTTGGIYGTVTHVEGDDLVVEIADNVTVHMTRRGIAAVLPPEDEEDEEEIVDPDEIEDSAEDMDEGAITVDEEPVTAEVDGERATAERR